MSNPKTTVVVMAVATGGITFARRVATGDGFSPRSIVGALVAAIFLTAIADGAPRIAVGFAALMLFAALSQAGPETLRKLTL